MIKLICFDYDGVFSDGKIIINNDKSIKNYNVKDGSGIRQLINNNYIVCVISAFSHKNSNFKEIMEHLGIHKYSEGNKDKVGVLTMWLKEYNLTFNNVAYMGDDIGDINILEKVKFKCCPNDAHIKVKYICDFISVYNGGNGAIRELCDIIINDDIKLNTKEQMRNNILYNLNNNYNIDYIVDKILNSNNIYTLGVGKSNHIASLFSDLLKSININSFNLNLLNITHGDLGCINKNDLCIFFSKSGNTSEIIDIINLFNCYKIGVCCNKESKFNNYCDYTLYLPFRDELYNDKNINCIPSNSLLIQTIFVNICIQELIMKSNINKDIYKCNHPAGNIGKNLLKVKDVIINEYPKIVLNTRIKLNTILLEMTKYNIGCCFFVNDNNNLLGLLSDGDIRRLLLSDSNIEININNINRDYKYIDNDDKYINNINDKHSKFLPVIINNKIIGIVKL